LPQSASHSFQYRERGIFTGHTTVVGAISSARKFQSPLQNFHLKIDMNLSMFIETFVGGYTKVYV
jgi:hypothetical protein